MNRNSWTILCLAYVIGLLSTGVFGFPNPNPSWQQWAIVVTGLGLFTTIFVLFIPRLWRRGPQAKLWLAAGMLALVAVVHLQLRIPQPEDNDISYVLKQENFGNRSITVEGKVLSQGRITQSQRVQFWFEARKVNYRKKKENNTVDRIVAGKIYVTAPLNTGADLYPGQRLALSGILYQPRSASIAGSFDFKAYLNRQGAFVGLKALKVFPEDEGNEPAWGLWKLRQRIVNAQLRWLGSPGGPLVSAMVLGRQAVDLPQDISDRFIKAGLAHVLAASGFQVSLLLGTVLALTKNFSVRTQLIVGLSALIFYIGLTGIQPSIMRAGLMGAGTLVALVTERKVRPYGSLLLTATLLLLLNPLWIWDLGFSLSFLATLGLIITMPAMQKRLDWLPPAIASSISIPIAASVWTLPLLCYVFNTVAIYSIPVNIITAPLILAISLGGTISAASALILPIVGSAIALLLYYPIQLLVGIVEFFNYLPGNSVAVGKIPLSSLLLIYALICSMCLSKWWQSRWQVGSLMAASLLVVPVWYHQSTLINVTVLTAKQEPVLIVQNRGKVFLVNSGEANTARYTILPFLREQGVNRIDCAVAFHSQPNNDSAWSEIRANVFVKNFYSSLSVGETISIDSTKIEAIGEEHSLLQLQVQSKTWWLLPPSFEGKIPQDLQLKSPEVLLWFGKSLNPDWLDAIDPKVAIAASRTVANSTVKLLKQKQIQLYWTGRDGAMQWTPKGGFQRILAEEDKNDSLL